MYQETLDESLPVPPPQQALDESSPYSHDETLDFQTESSQASPLRSPIIEDKSNSSFLVDQETLEVEDNSNSSSLVDHETLEVDGPSPSSPGYLYSNNLSSISRHWSSPWPSSRPIIADSKPSVLPWGSAQVNLSMVGAGLANLGNTCFLNAVLQCFTHTVPLVQGLQSLDHPRPCDRCNEDFCVLCALSEHIELSLAFSGGIVSPLKLVNNLSNISSFFQRYQQEDAHEFLQCLLDRLDNSCLDLKTKDKNIVLQDYNLVKRIFGGRLVSKVRCCNCGHCSDTYEPLIDLSLEIEDVDNLLSALDSFTKVEKIEDPEMKFTCDNCKEKVSIEKQFKLESAPSIATFHLKRFKSDGSYVEKVDKHVDYPLELDLQPFTSGNQEEKVGLKYDLYAVVVHIGLSSTSGHYFCFVRSSPDTWYKLDDSKVSMVREDRVLSQEAYILFYARQGTPWFSSFMEVYKPCLDPYISNTSPKSVLDNVDHSSLAYPITENMYSRKVHETGDALEGIPTQNCTGSRHERDEANGDTGERDEVNEDTTGEREEVNEDTTGDITFRDNTRKLQGVSDLCDGMSSNFEKTFTLSPLKESQCDQKINEIGKDAKIPPKTPPQSSSPEIYFKESPEVRFQIQRDHLRTEKQVSCKRQLEKDLEDSKRMEALRYIKRAMPTSRSAMLAAAIRGSPGGDSPKKNKKRKGLPSPYKKASPPKSHFRQSPRDVLRHMATAFQ